MVLLTRPAPRVVYSILFYMLLMILIVLTKPIFLFTEDGQVRPFATSGGEVSRQAGATVFPLGVVSVVAAAGCLYVFAIIDLIYG